MFPCLRVCVFTTCFGCCQSLLGITSMSDQHSRIKAWMKTVHLSPRLGQQRKPMLAKTSTTTTTATASSDESPLSQQHQHRRVSVDCSKVNGHPGSMMGTINSESSMGRGHHKPKSIKVPHRAHTQQHCQHFSSQHGSDDGELKHFVSILVGEGLDLMLNVLNNAITLHKRVSGSKQSCLPSQRLVVEDSRQSRPNAAHLSQLV